MAAGAAGLAWRRFTLTISGANIFMLDSGAGNPSNTATGPVGGIASTTTTALAGAATQTLPLFTLEGGGLILACKCKASVAFTGGGLTSASIQIGVAGQTDKYAPRFNIFQAVGLTGANRQLRTGTFFKSGTSIGVNGAGAMTATGAVVGDVVRAIIPLNSAATWVNATVVNTSLAFPIGSRPTGAAAGFEGIVTAADQIQQLDSANNSAGAFAWILETSPTESDAAAGTVVNALITVAGGGATVSLLTAGTMEVFLLVVDAPQASLGLG